MRTFLTLFSLCLLSLPARAGERWAAYYTDRLPASAFNSYSLLVFDSHAHPELISLRYRDALALGYVSLAEKGDYRPWFAEMRRLGLLLKPVPGRESEYYIDVRKPEWAAMLTETIIPELLRQGFGGIMLDTADSAIALEEAEPVKYKGMKDALIRLIHVIRMHYPFLPIMLNRGFAVLPQAAADVDMVLAESIYSFYDAKTGKTHLQPQEHYASVTQMLKNLQTARPSLKIYTLDYWPPEDTAGQKAIYRIQRENGFIPYVSTPDLQSLLGEPE